MTPDDRAIGKQIHAIVRKTAPELAPKTWYGMPAYANKDGKVVRLLPATRGSSRSAYAMLRLQRHRELDDGSMWPVAYALTTLTAADEAKIAPLVEQAVS